MSRTENENTPFDYNTECSMEELMEVCHGSMDHDFAHGVEALWHDWKRLRRALAYYAYDFPKPFDYETRKAREVLQKSVEYFPGELDPIKEYAEELGDIVGTASDTGV